MSETPTEHASDIDDLKLLLHELRRAQARVTRDPSSPTKRRQADLVADSVLSLLRQNELSDLFQRAVARSELWSAPTPGLEDSFTAEHSAVLNARLSRSTREEWQQEASDAGLRLPEVSRYAATFASADDRELPRLPLTPRLLALQVEQTHQELMEALPYASAQPRKQKKRIKSHVLKAAISATGASLLTVTNLVNPAMLPLSFALGMGAAFQTLRDLAELAD